MKATFSLLALLLAAFALEAADAPVVLRGSDTARAVAQAWTQAYAAKHPGSTFDVAGGSAASAFAALAERKCTLALATRSMRYKESQPCEAAFGQRPLELKLTVNGVGVYINAANTNKVLSYDDLFGIFRGNYRNWKQVGGEDAPIVAVGEQTNTAPGELFIEEVLSGKSVAGDVRLMPAAEVIQQVAQNRNAIGFAALSSAPGVQGVAIKRVFSSTPVEPTPEGVANRLYPISRFVYGYLDPAARQGDLAAFLDWVRSDEGQEVAKSSGFYPLAAKWRGNP